jgi:DNA-binding transcriptional LysR family regulator
MVMELRSDRLRVFLAVNEEGGFSRAAAALGQTQSSVSQVIAALEKEVGEPLFVRDRRAARLTEAGQVLLGHAERVQGALEEARQALKALDGEVSGPLAIGTSDTLATYVLPPVLAAYRARYPGVALRLDNRPSPAVALKVAARELDLGLVSLPLPEQGVEASLRQQPLLRQQDVVILAPGQASGGGPSERARRRAERGARGDRPRRRAHPIGAGPIDKSALLELPLVLLDRTTATRAYLEAYFRSARRRPNIALEVSSVEVLKRLVELGFGASVVPSFAVEREVREGRLLARPLVGLGTERKVGLIFAGGAGQGTRAARAFAALAKELLRS